MAERRRPRSTRRTLAALGCVCVLLVAGCGNTLQNRPLTATALEPLVTAEHYPVYWLGARFDGMPLSDAGSDPSGAYSVQYGACVVGGPETCVAPLQLISSPDNSFVPGAGGGASRRSIRGVSAVLAQHGAVIEIATGPAVVNVRASTPALALAAARQMVPINELGRPGESLPKAQPNTGFADRPMEGQRPPVLQGLPVGKRR